jgi:Fe-S-cluster containining protein
VSAHPCSGPCSGAAGRTRALYVRIDEWFAERSRALPGVVPCRAGCSACCFGPFDISAADAVLLARGLARLDPATREEVVRRARRTVERARAIEPRWGPPWDLGTIPEERFDEICDALAREPCPLLDDGGRCRLYEERPLICRMMGLPMRTPAGRTIENACPIRDRFPAYRALEPQLFPLEDFEGEEARRLAEAARALFGTEEAARFETFIAGLIDALGPRSTTPPPPSPPSRDA